MKYIDWSQCPIFPQDRRDGAPCVTAILDECQSSYGAGDGLGVVNPEASPLST